jgi:hypothetical protein
VARAAEIIKCLAWDTSPQVPRLGHLASSASPGTPRLKCLAWDTSPRVPRPLRGLAAQRAAQAQAAAPRGFRTLVAMPPSCGRSDRQGTGCTQDTGGLLSCRTHAHSLPLALPHPMDHANTSVGVTQIGVAECSSARVDV